MTPGCGQMRLGDLSDRNRVSVDFELGSKSRYAISLRLPVLSPNRSAFAPIRSSMAK